MRRRDYARWCGFAPPWWFNTTYIIGLIVLVYYCGGPNGGCKEEALVPTFMLLLMSIVAWTIACLAHLVLRGCLWIRALRQPPWRWSWVAIPIAFGVFAFLQLSGAVFELRWQLGKNSFARAQSQSTLLEAPCWVGPFYVTEVKTTPDGRTVYRLGWTDPYSDGSAEVVYAPGGRWSNYLYCIDQGGGWFVVFDPS
jgi:hypothetical protein